jgi:hypothetical protein
MHIMPTIKQTTVFKFSELSDKAKQHALEHFAQSAFSDSNDWEHVLEDAKQIASLFGLEVDNIYFSGFWSQGDGACYTGTYRYKKQGLQAVKDFAPMDTELHGIVSEIQKIQSKNFYRLYASIGHRGHYNHSGNMSFDIEDTESRYRDLGQYEEDLAQCLREFADWIYSRLNREYEYQTSVEVLTELIEINDYDFDENGELA